MDDKIFWAALRALPEIGSGQLRKLMEYFSTGEAVWRSSAAELQHSHCLEQAGYASLLALRPEKFPAIEALARGWEKQGIDVCIIGDENYPEILRHIYNPPALLFYRGTLRATVSRIAIVGSRRFSAYGRSAAEKLGSELAERGITVVSGAARGIDTAAHQGALRTGRTVAVLGCGVDVAYPAENRHLLAAIAEAGAVISEYAPGTAPLPGFFPARNRIISGLARGTVVVEAAARSGSLITAELALNEGRDVFAVPGSIYSPQSAGCHHLIQQGAKLVSGVGDILEEYNWKNDGRIPENKLILSKDEAVVYAALSPDVPLSIDEIICKLRSDVSNITFILLQLELRGLVKEYAPHSYIQAVKEDIL